jgi:hypothetical protein
MSKSKKQFILSPGRDPFNITPGRRKNAEWAKDLIYSHIIPYLNIIDIKATHIRDIHYIISGVKGNFKDSIVKPDGSPYINDISSWNLLVDALRDARYLKFIPFEILIDNKNEPKINARQSFHNYNYFSYTEEHIQKMASKHGLIDQALLYYKKIFNHSKFQNFVIEFWSEKKLPILEQVAEKYKILTNTVIGEGETSLTQVKELINRVQDANKSYRIAYLGDFDVVGMNLAKSMARKIEFYTQNKPEIDIKILRIALLPKQIIEYDLPLKPIKKSQNKGYETRKEKFYKKYGLKGAVEINTFHALFPDEFRQLLESFVYTFYDPEVIDTARRIEKETRKYVKRALEQAIPEFDTEQIDLSELIDLSNPDKVKSGYGFFEDKDFDWYFDSKRPIEEQFEAYKKI